MWIGGPRWPSHTPLLIFAAIDGLGDSERLRAGEWRAAMHLVPGVDEVVKHDAIGPHRAVDVPEQFGEAVVTLALQHPALNELVEILGTVANPRLACLGDERGDPGRQRREGSLLGPTVLVKDVTLAARV